MGVTNTNAYDGPFYPNGVATSFPFTFRTMSTNEVAIIDPQGETISGFSFSIVPSSNADGGSIVFDTAPTAAALPAFLIASSPNFGVGIDLGSVTAFNPRTLNPSFERLAVQTIFLNDTLKRTPQIPLGGGVPGLYPRVKADGEWGFSPAIGATAAAIGVPDDAPDLGIGWDGIVPDNPTVKEMGQALETAVKDRVTPAVLYGTLGSREANVLDIDDWDGTGNHDNAAKFQILIDQAAIAGKGVAGPGFNALMGYPLIVPQGFYMRGAAAGRGEGTNPALCSTFLFAHDGLGFSSDGSTTGTTGAITIMDISTRRIQPPVVPGEPWVCNDTDYDFHLPDVNNTHIERVLLQNASRGIYINGRNTLVDISGQCFKKGFHIDRAYDVVRIVRPHLWPFEYQQPEVRDYMQSQAIGYQLNRVDNPKIDGGFSIWHHKGISIGHYEGGRPDQPGGTTSKLQLSNMDLDIGDTAYYVAPNASGHSAFWSNVAGQGRNDPTGKALLDIQGPNTRIVGDFAGSRVGANIVRHEPTAAGSDISLRIQCKDWNMSGVGFPAIEVASGGGQFEVLPGSRFVNGNGAPNSGGNVIFA